MKIYKTKVYRVVLNFIYGVFAAGVAFFIADYFLDRMYSVLIAVGIFLSYLWLVVLDNVITITIDDRYMTVKEGRKEKRFEIAKCSFHAKMVTSSGDTSCTLDVTDENGELHYIDCELIGAGQFEMILEDLGVIGDKAQVNKVVTKKGE